ncbi:C10 family peptidase [Calditrichota bacterium]
MKKNFKSNYVILFLYFYVSAYAEQVSLKDVRSISQNFLSLQESRYSHVLKSYTPSTIDETIILSDQANNDTLAYIVNLIPAGFIVISNDTDIEPVLAYSLENDFLIPSILIVHDINLRKQTSSILPEYKEKNNLIWENFLNKDFTNLNFSQWPEPGTTMTGGWVETTWTQNAPYNDFCPLDPSNPSQHSATGCVAAAMSQIINYHQYANVHFDINDKYASNSIEIDTDSSQFDFPSFKRLNNYMDSVSYKYQNHIVLNYNDIAALNFACGISVKTEFSDQSGASISLVPGALKYKFNYNSANNKYPYENDFYATLKSDMTNAFPAILSLGSSISSNLGHAVICDGYNTDGYFHLNFGWGNNSPDDIIMAWYLLPVGIPEDYNLVNSAVQNIKFYNSNIANLNINSKFINVGGCKVADTSSVSHIILKNDGFNKISILDVQPGLYYRVGRNTSVFSDSLSEFDIEPGRIDTIKVVLLADSIGIFKEDVIITYSDAMGNISNTVIELYGNGVPHYVTIVNPGNVYGIWEKTKSPYYICGNINVQNRESLIIEPGVKALFLRYQLSVGQHAKLVAKGTETDSIIFTAVDRSLGWLGLKIIESGDDDTLSYCQLSYGKLFSQDIWNPGNAGIYCNSSSPVITHNIISHNFSGYAGAGILLLSYSDAVINNNLVRYNNALEKGGGIYCKTSHVIMDGNQLCNNSANYGGGTRFETATVEMTNNIINNNTAWSSGGGIDSRSSTLILKNNTICMNNSQIEGGGVLFSSNVVYTSENDIYWHNESQSGSQLWINYSGQENAFNINYCSVEGGISEIETNNTNGIYFANIDSDPHFVNPSLGIGTQYNGIESDWRLNMDSPCIDAGNPDDQYLAHDFCGNFRIWDGDQNGTSIVDIGATEFGSPTPIIPKIISTPITKIKEGSLYQYQIIATGFPKPQINLIRFWPSLFSFDDSSKIISGTPMNQDAGNRYNIIVSASNFTGIDFQSFTIEVLDVNNKPEISNFPDSIIFCSDSTVYLKLNDYVKDVDNPDSSLIWSISGHDSLNITLYDKNKVAEIKSVNGWCGYDTLIFFVSDDSFAVDQDTLFIHVLSPAEFEWRQIPKDYFLAQNFPNPFNRETTINYHLPQSGNVTISVYNIAGQLISTVLNDFRKTGKHTFRWNGLYYASGLYFYKIEVNNFSAVKKCILLK